MSKKRFLKKALFFIIVAIAAFTGKLKAQEYRFSAPQAKIIRQNIKELELLEKRIEMEKHGFSETDLKSIIESIKQTEKWIQYSFAYRLDADFPVSEEVRKKRAELEKKQKKEEQELLNDLETLMIDIYQFTINEEKIHNIEKLRQIDPLIDRYKQALRAIQILKNAKIENPEIKKARDLLIEYITKLFEEDARKLLCAGLTIISNQKDKPNGDLVFLSAMASLDQIGDIFIEIDVSPDHSLTNLGNWLKYLKDIKAADAEKFLNQLKNLQP